MCGAECPVCYEPLGEPAGPVAQNAVGCPRGHNVCTSCARSLVRPSKFEVSGLVFQCPLCRTGTALTRLQMMVLLKGTWREARLCFETDEDEREWMHAVKVTTPITATAVATQ